MEFFYILSLFDFLKQIDIVSSAQKQKHKHKKIYKNENKNNFIIISGNFADELFALS